VNSEKTDLRLDESQGDQPARDYQSPEDVSFKAPRGNPGLPVLGTAPREDLEGGRDGVSVRKLKFPIGVVKIAATIVLGVVVLSFFARYRWSRTSKNGDDSRALAAPAAVSISRGTLHVLAADNTTPYIDRSGSTWESDHFCSGGSSFSGNGHAIQGTEDQQLFSSGRRGTFTCKYPVPPGTYEVHLLFAETSGLKRLAVMWGFRSMGDKLPTWMWWTMPAGMILPP
jgi:hypothetical protein